MRTTPWQLFRFGFVYFNSQSTVFLVPALLASSSYQAWIGVLGGYLLNLILLGAMIYIGSRYPEQPWIQFGKKLMGKWLHSMFVIILLAWCVYYTSYDIQSFVLFFGSNYLRDTPPWFIQIAIAPIIMYTAMRGVKNIIYMADGLFVLILTSTTLMLLLFSQQANFHMLSALQHHLLPVSGLFENSLTSLSWFAEWMVFLFIVPDLKLDKNASRSLFAIASVLCLLVITGWLMVLMNFGPQLARQFQYPFLEIVRSVEPDSILSKVAPLVIGIWTTSMFIHSAFLIYVASRCATYFTKEKGQRLSIVLLTAAAVSIAFYYSNHLSLYQKHYYSFEVVIIWIIVECIPVYYTAVYLVGLLRHGKSLRLSRR
ncbi:GerAB/ArcD/ProY family transporter [Paenibacillus sanguinis]|uniref:GerAB/ArcD/ProY family transporter n=1 Tax=Paenibacillus sanguinis TaxID=225906 RepID=UPI000374BE45|nr:GerAB/ArcD/ProY family transporter [Paenibacillus sanguinis]